jgi:hypothetical protein
LNVHEKFIHDIGEIQNHESKLSQAGNLVGTEIGLNYLFVVDLTTLSVAWAI